jgi:transcriptional regulator with XRE-family HTH domain
VLHSIMATTKQLADAHRTASRIHRNLAEDIRRFRVDTGLSGRALASAAGIDAAYLRRIEDGLVRPSLDTYAKVAIALGADLSSRLYPNTGPSIRDRHQARMLEALISMRHPRWQPYPEVAVRAPSRGWIDLVFHAPRERSLVAIEIQSDLRRLEQLLRWFPEKVASLPSWEGWAQLGEVDPPTRLLLARSTRATRSVGREFASQLATVYPVHPADALASLTGTAPWLGSALIWADTAGSNVRFLTVRQAGFRHAAGSIEPRSPRAGSSELEAARVRFIARR